MTKETILEMDFYMNGHKVLLSLVDRNLSVLIAFENKREFAVFVREVKKAEKEFLEVAEVKPT